MSEELQIKFGVLHRGSKFEMGVVSKGVYSSLKYAYGRGMKV